MNSALAIVAGMNDTGHEKSAIIAPLMNGLGAVGGGVMRAASKYLPRLGSALMTGAPTRALEIATNPQAGPLAQRLATGAAGKAIAGREKLVGAGALGLGALGINHMMRPPVEEEQKLASALSQLGGAVTRGAEAVTPSLGAAVGGAGMSRAKSILARARARSLSGALANRATDSINSGVGAGALGVLGGAGLAARAGAFDEVPNDGMSLLG